MKKLLLFLICLSSLHAEPVKRKVIAFWDSYKGALLEDSITHPTLEMPLNYLGIDVIYHDLQETLPSLSNEDDILGILISFKDGYSMDDPREFLEWSIEAIDLGKRIVLIGNNGFQANRKGVPTSGTLQNRLFEKIGFRDTFKWTEYPFDFEVKDYSDELFFFEKKFPKILPPLGQIVITEDWAKSYLQVENPEEANSLSDLVIISPKGAFIETGYANIYDLNLMDSNPRGIGWYINPFAFFEKAFGLEGMPRLDPTTLCGRRIFFSTLHGDNWDTVSSIESYKLRNGICAEVLYEEVLKKWPNSPFAVGTVAANLDPDWVGKPESRELATRIFALENVETASHSYSHPFLWEFFEHDASEKEIQFLHRYRSGTWQSSYLSWFRSKYYQVFSPSVYKKSQLKWGYVIPRAYANFPFNLELDIVGSCKYADHFAPAHKPVELYIWPGDSRAWADAVKMCYDNDLANFGGGRTRFDNLYNSYLYVFPLARKPGGYVQLYAAADGDNAYTNEWSDDFFGFQNLPPTLENTGYPRRVKPIELYFHAYSGQFEASVNAINKNLQYIHSQPIIPIQVKHYCKIGGGFFTGTIDAIGKDIYQIASRQRLETVRFDAAQNKSVDFTKSDGILGFNYFEDSLYVHLDENVEKPILALSDKPSTNTAYLVQSNWFVHSLERGHDSFKFRTKGWGPIEMEWVVPKPGTYKIQSLTIPKSTLVTTEGHTLRFKMELGNNRTTHMEIFLQ